VILCYAAVLTENATRGAFNAETALGRLALARQGDTEDPLRMRDAGASVQPSFTVA
jgi:hypothetical protein